MVFSYERVQLACMVISQLIDKKSSAPDLCRGCTTIVSQVKIMISNREINMKLSTILTITGVALAAVSSGFLLPTEASAQSFKQVKATWSGDGAEPGIKEFADIACVSKGFASAVKYDENPASGAFEENGDIISYMEFASLDCK